MSEYIEREALLRALSKEVGYDDDGEQEINSDTVFITIEGFPTADVVPAVRGEWVMDTDPDDGDCRCSNCKVCINALHRRNHKLLNALGYKLHTFYKFCPNCGADMRGSEVKE